MKLASEKKLQRHMIRFLMIDSQQNSFNAISKALEEQHYLAQGKLLDDVASFEKTLNLQWDAIIFNNAYDFDYKKALELIEAKGKSIPLILLSDLDPSYPDILEAYQLGVYVVCTANNYDFLTLSIYRASVYTRLVRRENQLSLEIDNLQQQTQTLSETTEHAVAIFQEGVHVFSNEQYVNLFGLKSDEELLGLPLLDILQPQDIQEFKQQFKRLTKGDFSQSCFSILTHNELVTNKTLSLNFSATEFDGESALQLVILSDNVNTDTSSAKSTKESFINPSELHVPISTALIEKPAAGLISFTLESIPTEILEQSWNYFTEYCKNIETGLVHTNAKKVFRIAEHVFISILAVDNQKQLDENLQSILKHMPKTAEVNGNLFKVELSVGSILLSDLTPTDDIGTIITQAQRHKANSINNTSISLETPSLDLEVAPTLTSSISLTEEPKAVPHDPGLSFGEVTIDKVEALDAHNPFKPQASQADSSHQALLQQIENNSLKLSFQQLYDKEDIDTHLYEVTASFKYDGKMIDIEDYETLNAHPELAVKLDRWILVEASKRLHQFLTKCPKARIIVNMHSASFNDTSLVTLLTKLVNLINSKYTKPLILQFEEESILTDLDNAAKFINAVQEYGVGITIANFGESNYSASVLNHIKPMYAKLAPTFSTLLESDDSIIELQEKLDTYKEAHPEMKFVLASLNDMSAFANAWNVDARYLQGDYFQAKQTDFVNNAS